MAQITTVIQEGSTSRHVLDLRDAAGNVIIPASLEYRLLGDYGPILDWTSLDVTSTEVVVTTDQNTIGSNGPRRYLTVRAVLTTGDVVTGELEYVLKDLKGV